MPLQNPITDVDHVNVLLDDDVAGKRPVVHPITQAALRRRGFGPCRAIDVAGQIVSFAADDIAQRAAVNAPDQLHKRRAVANLEPDVEAELTLRAFADFNNTQRAGYVDSHRLLEIDVLPGGDDGFQMLRVIVGRRGDDDRIHFLRVRYLLVRVGAHEKL